MTVDWSQQGQVGWLTLNNPQRKNAMTIAMRQSMADRLEAIAFDESIRAVVVIGAGDTFCSGADIEQMGPEGPPQSRIRMQRGGHRIIKALHNLEKPVVSVVRGSAIGLGWSLALASDIVLTATTARFGMPHLKSGLMPDCGALYFLTRQIGLYKAKELIFSGRLIGAAEAHALGLATKIVDDAELDGEALRVAEELVAAPTFSLGLTKKLFSACMSPTLEEFLQQESLMAPQLRHTEDFREGIAAFREKRKPNFKGR